MKAEMGDWIWSIITMLEESGKIGYRVQVTLASSSLARLTRCWKSPSEAVTCVQGVAQQEKNTRKSWDRHSSNWEMKESTQCSKGTRFSSSLVIPSAFHLQVKGDFRWWQNCDSSKLRERITQVVEKGGYFENTLPGERAGSYCQVSSSEG